MNSADRFEFGSIRDEQSSLRSKLDGLDQRIDLLQRKLEAPPLLPVAPPVLPEKSEPKTELMVEPHRGEEAPAFSKPVAETSVRDHPKAEPVMMEKEVASPPPLPPPPPPLSADKLAPSDDTEPLELRVGTYWMSRIGIVILLTGLVFLGNYAYHRFVALLGPAGKLALLALAGGGLAGLGLWLEKKSESLKNFGRVLLGGGGATLYYTAYAVHFISALRVIESALLGGALLLAVAGGILWFAERRRSETTAFLIVLLSYYTSAINSIGAFTLFSNLLLTAVAVVFLVRHRWTRLSVLSLVATYGSYGFWRFHQLVEFHTATGLGMGPGFLAGYWVMFTVAAFLVERGAWPAIGRATFLTLNNGVFFAFGALHFAMHRPGAFGNFALAYGVVLLGLAALAARRHAEEPPMDGAYLAQGIALVTTGLVTKFTGPQLAIVLAIESAALLPGTRWRHGWLYEAGAALCALGAFCVTVFQIVLGGASSIVLGVAVAVMLLASAWWLKWLRGEWVEGKITRGAFGYSILGLLLLGPVFSHHVSAAWLPLAYTGVTIAGLLAFRLRLPEIAWPAQGFAVYGALMVIGQMENTHLPTWWAPLPLLLVNLGLMHAWQLTRKPIEPPLRTVLECVFAATIALLGVAWLDQSMHGEMWLVATSAVGVGLLAYGLATRSWPIAVAGQLFNAFAVVSFFEKVSTSLPHWAAALAAVVSIGGTSWLLNRYADRRWPKLPPGGSWPEIARVYGLLASVMFAVWSFTYVPADMRMVYFSGLGAAQIFLGSLRKEQSRIIHGVIYATIGLLIFWRHLDGPMMAMDLLAMLTVPIALRLGGRYAGEAALKPEVRHVIIGATLASAWMWVTRWTVLSGFGPQLTTAWTLFAFAVLGAGLALRERLYRLSGFAVLGLSVLRLFIIDVWRFDTIYRIVSFIALGAALLVLSFVYHRFAEMMRKWL
jgi:uncharacterized membrane protein